MPQLDPLCQWEYPLLSSLAAGARTTVARSRPTAELPQFPPTVKTNTKNNNAKSGGVCLSRCIFACNVKNPAKQNEYTNVRRTHERSELHVHRTSRAARRSIWLNRAAHRGGRLAPVAHVRGHHHKHAVLQKPVREKKIKRAARG